MSFLQRWRHLTKRAPYDILDKQLGDLFCHNLNKEIGRELCLKYLDTFDEVIDLGFWIKQTLINDGTIKINDDKDHKGSSSNHKILFWAKNKNLINDRVVDTKNTKTSSSIYNLKGSSSVNISSFIY